MKNAMKLILANLTFFLLIAQPVASEELMDPTEIQKLAVEMSPYGRCSRHFSSNAENEIICFNGVTLWRVSRDFYQCTVECRGIFSNEDHHLACYIGCNFAENQ